MLSFARCVRLVNLRAFFVAARSLADQAFNQRYDGDDFSSLDRVIAKERLIDPEGLYLSSGGGDGVQSWCVAIPSCGLKAMVSSPAVAIDATRFTSAPTSGNIPCVLLSLPTAHGGVVPGGAIYMERLSYVSLEPALQAIVDALKRYCLQQSPAQNFKLGLVIADSCLQRMCVVSLAL